MKFLQKSSIFNLNKEDFEKEDNFPPAQPPTFLGHMKKYEENNVQHKKRIEIKSNQKAST